MIQLIRKIELSIQQYGFSHFLILLFHKGLAKANYFYDVYLIYTCELKEIREMRPLKAPAVLKHLDMADFLEAPQLGLSEKRLKLFKERFRSGTYQACGIYENGVLGYFFWISTDELELPEPLNSKSELKLEKDEGFLVDGYCHPDFRGRGYHGYGGLYLMNLLYKMGYKRAVTVINIENTAARHSQEKIGFKSSAILTFKGFGRSAKVRKKIIN